MANLKPKPVPPRVRQPGEAMPRQVVGKGTYELPNMEPIRPGANAHLQIKSKGF